MNTGMKLLLLVGPWKDSGRLAFLAFICLSCFRKSRSEPVLFTLIQVIGYFFLAFALLVISAFVENQCFLLLLYSCFQLVTLTLISKKDLLNDSSRATPFSEEDIV